MNILIIGASTEISIGTQWRNMLVRDGHSVLQASRNSSNIRDTSTWISCDVTDAASVQSAVKLSNANLIIHAAGHLLLPKERATAGAISAHAAAKIIGAHNCFDALDALRNPTRLIIVGGEIDASNKNPLSVYGAINTILTSMCTAWQNDFDSGRSQVRVDYLGLPPVVPSTMMSPLLEDARFTTLIHRAVSIKESYRKLQKLLT